MADFVQADRSTWTICDMTEHELRGFWVSLMETDTGADLVPVLMKHFQSQDQLAKCLGVSKSRVSEMKTDKSRLSDRRRTAILGAFVRLKLRDF